MLTKIYTFAEEADQFLGMSMTYSLFEWVRESLDTLLTNQPETLQSVCDDLETKLTVDTSQDDGGGGGKSKVKKEQLSKAQKIGLKHFDDFEKRIPREEIEKVDKLIKKHVRSIDKRFTATVCGR